MTRKLPPSVARELLNQAREAMRRAMPQVSDFPVGAALRTAAGKVYPGCNIESPSLLQVFCAERVALLAALSQGERAFTHIAIVAAKQTPIAPCGLCRQMLAEFASDILIISEDAAGKIRQWPLAHYFPEAFEGP
jgi:cytidine deaminase